jgi:hypothetical protein
MEEPDYIRLAEGPRIFLFEQGFARCPTFGIQFNISCPSTIMEREKSHYPATYVASSSGVPIGKASLK